MRDTRKRLLNTSLFIRNESGAMAVAWALVMTGVIFAAGGAYDLSNVHAARTKARSIADTAALTAAIYVKEHGQLPASDAQGYVHDKSYNLDTLGFDISPYVTKTGESHDSWLSVSYDGTNGQVVAKVNGKAPAAFMSLAGFEKIDFQVSSTVKYEAQDLNNSLSIAFVLDTSGSMMYYDETGVKREDAMENAVIDLMSDLDTLVAVQEENGRILRTGMVPYYDRVWTSHVVDMQWGTIPSSDISRLYEGGGTNSSGAMEEAALWMQSENAVHNSETGRDNPKKYVVFMTDGVNNRSSYDTDTITACNAMKAAGVEIYTIGYALTQQTYGSGQYRRGRERTYTPSAGEITQATALLSNCASSASHFKTTNTVTDLDDIFDGIGADIAQNHMRISH